MIVVQIMTTAQLQSLKEIPNNHSTVTREKERGEVDY